VIGSARSSGDFAVTAASGSKKKNTSEMAQGGGGVARAATRKEIKSKV
jgi:hypothetical protein